MYDWDERPERGIPEFPPTWQEYVEARRRALDWTDRWRRAGLMEPSGSRVDPPATAGGAAPGGIGHG